MEKILNWVFCKVFKKYAYWINDDLVLKIFDKHPNKDLQAIFLKLPKELKIGVWFILYSILERNVDDFILEDWKIGNKICKIKVEAKKQETTDGTT